MTTDPDEAEIQRIKEYRDPAYATQLLEKIEWRLMHGEYGGLRSIKIALWAIVGLLILLLLK